MKADHPRGRDALHPVVERGPWVATSLGGMWSLLEPDPADVFIEDIAAGLARNCRYGGQLKDGVDFYSVAEHSLLMTAYALETNLVGCREDALEILLHDAAEAYLGDIPTPLKNLMPGYKEIESRAEKAIREAFGLAGPKPAIVKVLDRRIRVDERPILIDEPAMSAGLETMWAQEAGRVEPLGVEIECMQPLEARDAFRNMFAWCLEALPSRSSGPEPVAVARAQEATREPAPG